tara:strand:+ start:157 stop:861 length:705 start_codon:yes stop_codon:yes gene_type:complete
MLDDFHNFYYNREEMLEEDIRDILKSAILAAGITMAPSDAEGATPRGIRNNNPGNIKHGDTWKGEVKSTDKTFEQFKDAEHGIRAIGVLLRTYNTKYNLDTIDGIISRWAPKSENQTQNYINFVSKQLGVRPTTKLNLFNRGQIYNRTALKALVNAIIRMETGYRYPDSTIEGGLNLITPGKTIPSKANNYTIKSGDTLSHIASRNKIKLSSLLNANPGINPRKLQIGQKIILP